MKTISTQDAAELLRGGGVVLAPTETVVGLIAAEPGLPRLSEIKGRDQRKPIAFLCATAQQAFELAAEVPVLAEKLAGLYWPGPLTLVLPAAGGGTIGVRVPDHETVTELLLSYGGPLYATSANRAGDPPPAAVDSVDPRVSGAVDALVGGETGGGIASAVVDLSGGESQREARLLRANESLGEEDLSRLVREAEKGNV